MARAVVRFIFAGQCDLSARRLSEKGENYDEEEF